MINQLCDPLDPVSDGEHKHKCEGCGTCWKHTDEVAECGDDDIFDEAHACPNCGQEQTWKLRPDGTQVPKEEREWAQMLRALFSGGL